MEAYIADWLNLLLRWLHLITGVAWIGASFYFVWLDNHLEALVGGIFDLAIGQGAAGAGLLVRRRDLPDRPLDS